MVCPKCGSSEVFEDINSSSCVACGHVLADGHMVSEVGFVDNGDGTSAVTGQFVSERGSRFNSRVPGFSRQSREITIEKARRRIQDVASSLRLGNSVVEAAHRFYKLALQHNFVQGRRTQHVVAACLYMACRKAPTPHVLQTNVFVLGRTFLQLCHLMSTSMPLIDPSLYIQRFAARLEFEEKTHVVSNTALRLVQRLKRDWIQTGRRPAGICGASLYIAAKYHGFRRTHKEIAQVVRICEATLRKRLSEFEETESSLLTAEEFETIDLETENDPPAYTNNKKKESKKRKQQAITQQLQQQGQIEEEEDISVPDMDLMVSQLALTLQNEEYQQLEVEESSQISQLPPASMPSPLSISSQLLVQNKQQQQQQQHEKAFEEPVSENIDDNFSDIEDQEIEAYLNTKQEIDLKTELWEQMNKDYLKILEKKQKEKQEQEQKPKKPRKKREITRIGPAETAYEAATEMMKKKVSSRLNYTVVQELFPDKIAPSTPVITTKDKLDTSYGSDYDVPVGDYDFPSYLDNYQ